MQTEIHGLKHSVLFTILFTAATCVIAGTKTIPAYSILTTHNECFLPVSSNKGPLGDAQAGLHILKVRCYLSRSNTSNKKYYRTQPRQESRASPF